MDPRELQTPRTTNVVLWWLLLWRIRTKFLLHVCQNVFNSANFTISCKNKYWKLKMSQSKPRFPFENLMTSGKSLFSLSTLWMGSEHTFPHTHNTQKQRDSGLKCQQWPFGAWMGRSMAQWSRDPPASWSTTLRELLYYSSCRWGQAGPKEPQASDFPIPHFSGYNQHISQKIFYIFSLR